jgi:multidrug efflux system outer membrane protein
MHSQISRRVKTPLSVLVSTSLLLSGCVIGPSYTNPEMRLPDAYSRLAPVPVARADQALWWQSYNDPVLNQLVAHGLAANVGLAEAEARVREAEAQARRAGNTVSGNLSAERQAGTGTDTNQGNITLGLDPFGGRRRQSEAALERLQAARYGAQDARLSLLQTLAQAYVDLRFYQESVAEQQKDLTSRRQTLRDINTLLNTGQATQLDRLRAEALVAETQARIPKLNANVARQQNRIATLLGVPAGSLGIDLTYRGRQPTPSGAVALGIPADLVRRRPDILRAERLYAAAVSDIGAAEAARYPSLSLSGQIIAPLDSALATSQTLTVGLVLPLFDQPGLAAQADAARARADQAYLQWRSVVLTAVEDVETALAAISGSRLAARSARRVVALDTEALGLSRKLLDSRGDVTVLDLLDRERAVSDARATLAQSLRDYATDTIALHVALGLGPDTPVTEQ